MQVGSKVTEFKKGDHAVTLFNQGHQYGEINVPATHTGLGGMIDGALRQYGVFNEKGLVKAAKNLSARENSTLTCAALTSWNALYGLKPLRPGQIVLVQGTGGVSMFGLQVSSGFVQGSEGDCSTDRTVMSVRQSCGRDRHRHDFICREGREA